MNIITTLFQVLAAFFGTVAFGIMFRVPAKHLTAAGMTAAIVWLVYLLVHDLIGGVALSILCSAFAAVVIARAFAVIFHCPATIFLVAGIFPLVPGAGIYNTVYAAITADYISALALFLDAFKNAFTIAIAISIGFMIPNSVFAKLKRFEISRS